MDYFYFGVIPTTLVILVFILVVVRVVISFLFHFFSLGVIKTPAGSVTDGAAQEQRADGCSGNASLRVVREDGGGTLERRQQLQL